MNVDHSWQAYVKKKNKENADSWRLLLPWLFNPNPMVLHPFVMSAASLLLSFPSLKLK